KNLTADGGFGSWSLWQPCEHTDADNTGSCMCRSRLCDSPAPRCGGYACEGPTTEVANCSRNGAWTVWSSWAQCSTTCGIGFQVRQRSCSNPTPRYGGRVCVGQSREERFCNENNPCPLPMFWSSWGPWNKCSAECGGGIHSRQRNCENGNSCPGCAVEYKTCNSEPCPEVRRNTPWSPWMPINITQNGARQEQRFRYTCRAQLADPHNLQFGKKKTESRLCPSEGSSDCETDSLVGDLLSGKPFSRVVSGGWAAWGLWSSCSRDCETGFRNRKRMCTSPEPKNGGLPCVGPAMEYQNCNPQPCPVKGSWSCWSPWSQCSTTCGGGHYQRTRTCTNPAPSNGGDICIGLHTEEALCNTHPCEGGWSDWSEWSLCSEEGLQRRSRYCEIHNPALSQCIGNSTQYQTCLYNEIPVILPASSVDKDTNCGELQCTHLLYKGCSWGAKLVTAVLFVLRRHVLRQILRNNKFHALWIRRNHYYSIKTRPKKQKNPIKSQTLNKSNLIPDERTNFYHSPLQQTNVYATTYYPSTLNKYDYR
uniref:Sema5A/B-like TSP-1 type 1 domain-containing protein n=1 Tax=Latimeria chalumnae TaxID=7897 RepID=H3AY29_LATCH